MQDLRLTLLQANLHWESSSANLAMFEEMIWKNSEPTDIIVLPEMFSTGFTMKPQNVAEPHNFNTFKWMRQIADQKNCAVLGSFVVKERQDYFNRLYVVCPGKDYYVYDKKHLFKMAGEDEEYSPGQDRLIFEWRGWKICPMVCYDLRFPVWARNQLDSSGVNSAYDVLIYVANWPKPRIEAWDTLLKARAIENQSFVVGVNRVGKDANDYEYTGHSAVYDFGGKSMVFKASEATALHASLNYESMMQFRKKLPFLKDADSFTIHD